MALPKRYGSAFLAGTKGQTFAAGYDIDNSGVVDGGTIVKAGNKASDSPVTSALSIDTLADNVGDRSDYGSKIVANVGTGASTTDRVGVSGAIASNAPDGTGIAFNAGATNWIMQGGNVTTTLNGVANTRLSSPAREIVTSDGGSNDVVTKVARTKIGDIQHGAYASRDINLLAEPSTEIQPYLENRGASAGSASTFVNPADGTAAVKAEIAPTRSVPGELTYHFGGLGKPTTDAYKAKDAYEDETDTSS